MADMTALVFSSFAFVVLVDGSIVLIHEIN